MNRTTIDLWVGIFVALGLGAIVFLSLKVGNLATFKSDEGYHLDARFDNIGGLKVRAPVKSAGVVVGRVEKIRLDPKTYEAIATCTRTDLPVHEGYDSLDPDLGLARRAILGLEPGGTGHLKDGDRIAKTQSAWCWKNCSVSSCSARRRRRRQEMTQSEFGPGRTAAALGAAGAALRPRSARDPSTA
jgi:phospholipid/cholesterol/gamma-HCH transport system substrate-binding protein